MTEAVSSSSDNVDLAVQGLSVQIVSYNCRFNLGFDVDMRLLVGSLLSVDYHPRYPTARVRLVEPQCCISVSYHGHCTIFGCESISKAVTAAAVFSKLINQIADFANLINPSPLSVVSITCITDLGHGVHLETAVTAFTTATYEPEVMPSLRVLLVINKRRVCCSVFANGQVTIVGAQNILDARDAIKELYTGLSDHFIP